MRLRRAAWALGAAVVVTAGGGVAVEHVGASALIYAPNAGHPPDAPGDPPAPALGAAYPTRALRVDVGPPRASLSIHVIDGSLAAQATVLVLHGIRDRKESMLGWGRRLADLGYRAVLVDARGHGRSSGDFLTYGVVEARDLSQVLGALDAQGLVVGKVGAMGVSYGAATAIEWAAIEPRVEAVVAVAPFASLRAVVPGYARRLVPLVGGLLPGFLVDRAIARAGRTAAFDPDEASPLACAARTRAPVLLLHGGADEHIPPAQSEAIHEVARDHSAVVVLRGETHDSIAADRSGALWREASGWLDTFLAIHPPPGGRPPPSPAGHGAPGD